jgi:hypothetical protein
MSYAVIRPRQIGRAGDRPHPCPAPTSGARVLTSIGDSCLDLSMLMVVGGRLQASSPCHISSTQANKIAPGMVAPSSAQEWSQRRNSQLVKPHCCLENVGQGVEWVGRRNGSRMPGEATGRGESVDQRVPWLWLFE